MFSFFITKKCSMCKEHRVPRIPNVTVCEWCSKIQQLESTIRRLTVKLDRTLEDNRLMERRMQMMRDQAPNPNSSYAPVKSSSAQVVSTNRRSLATSRTSDSSTYSVDSIDPGYFTTSVRKSNLSSITIGGGGDYSGGGATSSWTTSGPSLSDDSCSRSSYGGGSYDSSSSSSSSDSSSSSSSCD